MQIETLVFFDIETTGLPQFEKNRTKITELTFIAVSRQDIEQTTVHSLPLTNKLSLVFNPERKIQKEASRVTGLTNDILKNQPVFKNRIGSINTFLMDLPKPVCLVAHNGNRFDFKILIAEYCDADDTLPTDILCVDSLSGFQTILKNNNISNNFNHDISSRNASSPKCQKPSNLALCDEILTDDDTDDELWPALNTSAEEWEEIDRLSSSFAELSSEDRQKPMKKEIKTKQSYDLGSLYKKLINKEIITSHRAEADCMMLLNCVIAVKQYFLPWADKNCKPLNKIKPLVRK